MAFAGIESYHFLSLHMRPRELRCSVTPVNCTSAWCWSASIYHLALQDAATNCSQQWIPYRRDGQSTPGVCVKELWWKECASC